MTFAVMSPRRYERTKSALTCGLVHASYGYEAALGQFTELPLVSLRVFPQYSRAEWDGFLNEAPALLVVPIHRISYSSLQCHWLISQRRCMKACLEHLRRGQASRMPGSISLQSAVGTLRYLHAYDLRGRTSHTPCLCSERIRTVRVQSSKDRTISKRWRQR